MKRTLAYMLSHASRPFSRYSTSAKEGGVAFEDDWELIEVLDQEFAGDRHESEDDEEVYDPVDAEEPHSYFLRLASHYKIKYKILSKDDVRQLLCEKITKVSSVLSLSRSEAVALLIQFNWDLVRVHEEWVTSEESIRKKLGLYQKPVVQTSAADKITCKYCYESRPGAMVPACCGHEMCLNCWTEYVNINEGVGCLTIRCPEQSCDACVGIELIERVLNQYDMKKIDDYLLESYVNGSRKGKWCPASGCEYAVCPIDGDINSEVSCKCLHNFCWNCSKEAHTPIDCTSVNEWKSETLVQTHNWLFAKARPCPRCEKLIEEVSCQMYSQCPLCQYTFHNDAFSIRAPDFEEAEGGYIGGVRESAKSSLARYIPYYEAWSDSEACRINALTDLKVLQDIRLELLCRNLNLSESELEFLVEAHLQIVNCWRVIKWSNAFGFFMPTHEFLKKNLFEFLLEQGMRLLKMLEKEVGELVESVLSAEVLLPEYNNHCRRIIQLTRVTRVYFERLGEALKGNLSEVVSIRRPSPKPESYQPSSSRSNPARRVVKAEGDEDGTSSRLVDMESEVLIPRPSPQKGPYKAAKCE